MCPLEDSRTPTEATVSVIIPCYNMGRYLDEAVNSVLAQTYEHFEIIVVDDGSTDPETLEVLAHYNRPKTTVIRRSHEGVASSRNAGIRSCTGTYVLPLDGDDKMGDTYLEKAVRVLDSNDSAGIVYCTAELFGTASGPWSMRPYGFPRILITNMIFCTAMFRRCDWEKTRGYNPNMVYGLEDHDFWLSLIELGRDVFLIPETLFFYRKHADSLTAGMTRDHILQSFAQLVRNHPKLYLANACGLLRELAAMGLSQDRVRRVAGVVLSITREEVRRGWRAFKRLVG